MISPTAFSEPTATINLFDDATVSVTWLAHDPLVLGAGLMHRANPNSCNGCSLGIGVSGDQLNGFAYINGKQFAIETSYLTKSTRYLITEFQNVLLDPRNALNDVVSIDGIPLLTVPTGSISTKIDMLVLVTPQLLASDPQLPELNTYIAILNNALQINSVNKTIRRVGVRTVAANIEGMNAFDSLNMLATNGDGVMDEVHAARDLLGADIVTLFANYTGSTDGAATANSFAVVEYSRPTSPIYVPDTLAHEVGHHLGAGHIHPSISTVPCYGRQPYSCGHRLTNLSAPGPSSARTLMTYPAYCQSFPCDLIPSFSDPLVFYRGQPTGIANFADNGRTVREEADYVSSLRPEGGLVGGVDLIAFSASMELGSRVGAIQQLIVTHAVGTIAGRATNVVTQFNFTESFSRTPLFSRILPTPFVIPATNNSSVGNCSGLSNPNGTVECRFAWVDTQGIAYIPLIVEYSSAGVRPSFTFKVFADQFDVNPLNNNDIYEFPLPYPTRN